MQNGKKPHFSRAGKQGGTAPSGINNPRTGTTKPSGAIVMANRNGV
ncbi:hypothetical protein [Quatrionicoccus australiensis]|nr:hypothetical protein [Quatrionicoccus australiensis]MCB4358317.1 hypothetical protein [Quatrionicoccus australiensis]